MTNPGSPVKLHFKRHVFTVAVSGLYAGGEYG